MGISGIAPSRHCDQMAFRPAMVGIQALLGSFHWSAFCWLAFGHASRVPEGKMMMRGGKGGGEGEKGEVGNEKRSGGGVRVGETRSGERKSHAIEF